MDYDTDRIDDAVLALLHLTSPRESRRPACVEEPRLGRSGRLHQKGLIADPVGKAKFVVLTDEGAARAEELFRRFFSPTS